MGAVLMVFSVHIELHQNGSVQVWTGKWYCFCLHLHFKGGFFRDNEMVCEFAEKVVVRFWARGMQNEVELDVELHLLLSAVSLVFWICLFCCFFFHDILPLNLCVFKWDVIPFIKKKKLFAFIAIDSNYSVWKLMLY